MCWYMNMWMERPDGVDNYKWAMARPSGPASTPRQFPWGPSVNCKHRGTFGATVTVTKGVTTTFDGYFEVIGIQLDTNQQQSDKTSVTINPIGTNDPQYCMNASDIWSATLFEELR
jgi:hypothetical protein